MKIKKYLKRRIRQLLGLIELEEAVMSVKQSLDKLPEIEKPITQRDLYYGKYVIALEYPPSRDYQPRWGNTHPPHQGLIDLFNKYREDYCKLFHKLEEITPSLLKIKQEFSHDKPGEPGWVGGPINAIDTALLYLFMTEYQPKTYLEIGSGVTTLFAARAKRDRKLATRIVSIDPEPRAAVDSVCDEVIRYGLETADLSVFFDLEPGDIVFMDGSHRSFMNSDVTVFMLDVLPYLKPGVIIHFHDIVLPYDYPESFSSWYWNEQYILAAYLLAAKEKVKILMPSRFMSYTPELKQAISPMLKKWSGSHEVWLNGGSLWFTHVSSVM